MTASPFQKTTHHVEEQYTRLHIAPLNPELLKVIVPQATLPKARAISYHTLQAFPERPFGFIELPSADALKIKSKLNGAVLRGTKIRVEPARPDNMPKPDPDAIIDAAADGDLDRKSKKSKADKREKKRKRDPREIAGIELEEGRKVKRGWTVTPDEAKSKKKKDKEREQEKAKSKSRDAKQENRERQDKKEKKKRRRDAESEYTDGPECLVKTQLPPNRREVTAGDSQGHGAKKSRKNKKHEVVVHEFENTTKFPTYFKASKGAAASGTEYDFVEGKGWVDSNGNVVEEVKSTRPKGLPKTQIRTKPSEEDEDDDTTSSSGSSSEEGEESFDGEGDTGATKRKTTAMHPGLMSLVMDTAVSAGLESPSDSGRPKSASSARSLTIKIPPATPSSNKVHPLEALYKRKQQGEAADTPGIAGEQPFAFFSGEDLEEEDDHDHGRDEIVDGLGEENDEGNSQAGISQGNQLPMTPFSKQDFEWRGMRSAAPTPDTAHPSRYPRIWPLRDDREGSPGIAEGDEDDDQLDSFGAAGPGNAGAGEPTNPNTDFQKWFYENRGDLNRSWQRRRKVAAKQKRYRENKARAK